VIFVLMRAGFGVVLDMVELVGLLDRGDELLDARLALLGCCPPGTSTQPWVPFPTESAHKVAVALAVPADNDGSVVVVFVGELGHCF